MWWVVMRSRTHRFIYDFAICNQLVGHGLGWSVGPMDKASAIMGALLMMIINRQKQTHQVQ